MLLLFSRSFSFSASMDKVTADVAEKYFRLENFIELFSLPPLVIIVGIKSGKGWIIPEDFSSFC